MSNPNNLIRPPVLNTGEGNPAPSGNPRTPNLAELTPIITQIALEIVQRQVQEAINPNADSLNVRDQAIDEQYLENLQDLDKVPDVVKCLREFSGKPREFSSWKKSVDRILRIYENQKGTPRYYGILNVVRNKIVGNADIALESYNTPLDWVAISRCLAIHYADKRDLSTLEYQMTSLIQGSSTIQQFYQAVYSHLSLILNKLSCLEAGQEAITLLTETYRTKALDTFVRGLNGDLPKLLGMKEPADLPQALHLCLKLENQSYRANYAQNTNRHAQNNPQLYPKPPNQIYNPQYHFKPFNQPPIPPRQSRQMHYNNNQTFYPQLAFVPQVNVPYQQPYPNNITIPQYNVPNHTNFPPRPQAPKPQPRPEPMDIDSTMHSKRINYMNRPRQSFPSKRPPPPPSVIAQQPKIQRNFHIDVNPETVTNEQDDTVDQTLEEYVASIDETVNLQQEETQDLVEENPVDPIHFLQ